MSAGEVNAAEVEASPRPPRRASAEDPRPYLRPKDAATLIVLRRERDGVRLLMGRRSAEHVFMPGMVVFPGGRVDPGDGKAPSSDNLHPDVEAKLLLRAGTVRPARARALALAALREAFEEVGILVGARGLDPPRRIAPNWAPFLATGVTPSLGSLRLVARAITPPGRTRRFDARFFAIFEEAVADQLPAPEDELLAPQWLTFAEARSHPLPSITRRIVDDLEIRLRESPDLDPQLPMPFHSMRHGRFICEYL